MARNKGKRKAKRTEAEIAAEQAALDAAQRVRDFDAVNLQPAAAVLPMNDDVEVRHLDRERVDGARRMDAFDACKKGMAIGAYDAARALERLYRIRLEEGDRGGTPPERVNGGQEIKRDAEHRRAVNRAKATEKIEAVLAKVGERDAWLLDELIAPRRQWPNWRATVAYVTGEENLPAQAALVRHVSANLAAAFRNSKAA